MKKSVLNSPRLLQLKKKKRRAFLRKALFFLFFLFLILAGLSFLSRWKEININEIKISGNKVVETGMVEEMVKEKISGYYAWFFPKTNFLLYPRESIKKDLALKFKRLENISLDAKNFKTLEISLSERTPAYMYCGNDLGVQPSSEEKCYFMDADGYIFDEAPYFSGEIYLKFYGAANSGENPAGSYFLQPNFGKLILFQKTLEKIGLKPAAFYADKGGDIHVFLTSPSKSAAGPEIILKADADFNQMAENLQSVLATEPLQSDFKKKYSSLLYIDLRFGNKVYYKFK